MPLCPVFPILQRKRDTQLTKIKINQFFRDLTHQQMNERNPIQMVLLPVEDAGRGKALRDSGEHMYEALIAG